MKAWFLWISIFTALGVRSQEVDKYDLLWMDGQATYNDKPYTGVAVQYTPEGKAEELTWYKDGTYTGKKRVRPGGLGTIWLEERWEDDDLIRRSFIYPDDWDPETPLFTEEIDDTGFADWYRRFKAALYSGDSTYVLSFFADTMDFGRYNCNESVDYVDEEGNPRYACTKKGIVESYMYYGFEGFCQKVLQNLEYGIGKDQVSFHRSGLDTNTYSNLHFSDLTFAAMFFDYNMTIVTGTGLSVYAEPSVESEVISTFSHQDFFLGDVVIGCSGDYEAELICWLPIETDGNSGYVNGVKVLQATSYLKLTFSKLNGEWKCTAIYQPPGC